MPANRTANLSARDMVMLEFQRTSLDITRSFIESQQRVMLAYLTKGEMPGITSFAQIIPAQIPNYNIPAPQEMRGAELAAPFSQHERISETFTETPAAAAVHTQATYENLALAAQSNPPVPVSAMGAAQTQLMPAAHVATVTAAAMTEATLTPTAVSPTAVSPAASAATGDGSSPEQLIESLISIVADRTGYPPEMLDPTLDLEADLGIDSIKRVEILNSFRKLLPEEKQNALEDGIERLAGVKTLQGIMDWIRTELDPNKVASTGNAEAPVSELDSVSAQAG